MINTKLLKIKEYVLEDVLRKTMEGFAGSEIRTLGDASILTVHPAGFFCSVRCPGNVILRTYDLIRALRDAGIPVIGGFQSPMEKECLGLLLRGQQPVAVCPARSIERMRIPGPWRAPLEEGRLLVASPFEAQHRRPTAALSEARNRFVVGFGGKGCDGVCGGRWEARGAE